MLFLYRTVLLCLAFCGSVLISFNPAFASEVTDKVNPLIEQGHFDEARAKIKEYLAKNPKNVDALMMQGNVILQEYWKREPTLGSYANDNESIYDSSIGFIGERERRVSRDVALQVAALWKRCLAIDNTREDIHKGLAYLYAMALMKQELIQQLGHMKAALPHAKELQYNMGDYARMFNARGRFNDAVDVFREILKLYPNDANVYNDLAALYFLEGHLKEAQRYMAIAVSSAHPDDATYGTAVMIFTMLTDYDRALDASKHLSRLKKDNRWLLYRALLLRSKGEVSWKADLSEFLRQSGNDADDLTLAKLLTNDSKNNFDVYTEVMAKAKKNYQLVLLHRWAMRTFPTRYEPQFKYAEIMNQYRNYDESVPVFKRLAARSDLDTDKRQTILFHYAWAFQDSGRLAQANALWNELTTSNNFYVKSAAVYFLGKEALRKGDNEQALAYFRRVSDDASKSKYATLAWNKVNWFKEQKK